MRNSLQTLAAMIAGALIAATIGVVSFNTAPVGADGDGWNQYQARININSNNEVFRVTNGACPTLNKHSNWDFTDLLGSRVDRVHVSLTVVNPSATGYISATNNGSQQVSQLSWVGGQARQVNAFSVQLSSGDLMVLYASTSVKVCVDLLSYGY